MSQTFTTITETNQLRGFPIIFNDNLDAIRSQWSGTSAPGSPVVGQPFYNTTTGYITIWNGTAWIDPAQASASLIAVSAEVIAARGTASSLDARLSISMNPDGTLKDTLPVGNWWMDEGDTVSYVNTTTFTVSGDKTAIYLLDRAVYLIQTTNAYDYVLSSTYSAGTDLTTVVVKSESLDGGLTTVQYGQPVSNSPDRVKSSDLGTAAVEDVATGGTGDLLREDGSAASLTDVPGDVITTRGDIIVGNSSGDPARLAAKSEGDMLYYDSNGDLQAVTAGTEGQVVTYNSSGIPVAKDVSGGRWGLVNAITLDGDYSAAWTGLDPGAVYLLEADVYRAAYTASAITGIQFYTNSWLTIGYSSSTFNPSSLTLYTNSDTYDGCVLLNYGCIWAANDPIRIEATISLINRPCVSSDVAFSHGKNTAGGKNNTTADVTGIRLGFFYHGGTGNYLITPSLAMYGVAKLFKYVGD